MNFTITGSLGNTGRPLTSILLQAGHRVTVVSSNPAKADEIKALGAIPAIGSLSDSNFLAGAFSGADAVYTMVPPDMTAPDYRAYISSTGSAFVEAIKASGVTRVVNLSSIGAHLDGGTGPIAGLHDVEQLLNAIPGIALRHLRAGFFYTNFYANTDMIRHAGILGSNYGPDTILRMVYPGDIAQAAAEALQEAFTGISVRYVISDERVASEVAAVIGKAIGKPELPWVGFDDEQALAGMLQAGLHTEIANKYVEMGTAVRSGRLWEDYLQQRAAPLEQGIKLEQFAADFARAYHA